MFQEALKVILIPTNDWEALCCAVLSFSVVFGSLQPHGLQPARLLCSWRFSRQEYWNGLTCLPLGDLPNPGIELRSPTLWQILYCLSHQGSPEILDWVVYPFSRGLSWPRNWTGVSCTAGGFCSSWSTREALEKHYLRAKGKADGIKRW